MQWLFPLGQLGRKLHTPCAAALTQKIRFMPCSDGGVWMLNVSAAEHVHVTVGGVPWQQTKTKKARKHVRTLRSLAVTEYKAEALPVPVTHAKSLVLAAALLLRMSRCTTSSKRRQLSSTLAAERPAPGTWA
jgi:hypothetical protein